MSPSWPVTFNQTQLPSHLDSAGLADQASLELPSLQCESLSRLSFGKQYFSYTRGSLHLSPLSSLSFVKVVVLCIWHACESSWWDKRQSLGLNKRRPQACSLNHHQCQSTKRLRMSGRGFSTLVSRSFKVGEDEAVLHRIENERAVSYRQTSVKKSKHWEPAQSARGCHTMIIQRLIGFMT